MNGKRRTPLVGVIAMLLDTTAARPRATPDELNAAQAPIGHIIATAFA